MSTIYIMENGVKVNKDGGKIVISKKDGTTQNVPATYVDCLVVSGKANITYDVIQFLLREEKSIIYLDRDGCVLGSLGTINNQGKLCVEQVNCYNDQERRMILADKIISWKILAQRDLLNSYNKRLKSSSIKSATAKLTALARNAASQKDIKKLMGVEGLSARTYFDNFKEILGNSDLEWIGRKKHPAPDPVNCMLSYAYALVEKDVRIAIAEYGLLPDVGFVHSLNFRKDSLICDLMEPFRPSIADRFVLRCIKWKMFCLDDFVIEDGRCIFNDDSRKRFIMAYEDFVGSFDGSDLDMRAKINSTVRDVLQLMRIKNEELAA